MTAPHRKMWVLALLAEWDRVQSARARGRPEKVGDAETSCILTLLRLGTITGDDLAAQGCSRAVVAELRHLSGLDAETAAHERASAVAAGVAMRRSA